MRSFVLTLAVLASSAMAAPAASSVDCVTKGNTVVQVYEEVVTKTVYVTEGDVPTYAPAPVPTTSRKHHTHPVYKAPEPEPAPVYTPPPAYVPQPEPEQPKPEPKPEQPVAEGPKPSSGNSPEDFVNAHNYYRRKFQSCPDVQWSTKLESAARKWNVCTLQHSGNGYGENLAIGNVDGVGSVDMWAGEFTSYSYNNPGFDGSTGHFTQVVWKGTTHIGCFTHDCGGGSSFVVCNYEPAGNFLGQFDSQVPPLKPGASL